MAGGSVRTGTAVLKKIARAVPNPSTCAPGNDSGVCQKPTDSTSTQTLPIVLGVIIPISCAIIVFIWLHRKNKKKQALEDLNDPHKSLDFGYDMNVPRPVPAKRKRGKRGAPEMINTDVTVDAKPQDKSMRGLSMDMLGSPYLLPSGLSGSRESFHSMTRSLRDNNDPYRPVVFSRSSSERGRSPHPFNDNASTYSGSTMRNAFNDKSTLVSNAQRISQTYPDRLGSLSRTETKSSGDGESPAAAPASNLYELPTRKASLASPESKATDSSEAKFTLPTISSPSPGTDENHLSFPFLSELPAEQPPQPPPKPSISESPPPRTDSAGHGLQISVNDQPWNDSSSQGEKQASPPPPMVHEPEEMDSYDIDPDMIYTGRFSVDNPAHLQQPPVQNNRASVMGLRPLPPDNPEENAEQRANRIRSFYKEYFDTSKPNPANAYYEDYDADYTDYYYYDGWYDPDSEGYYYQEQPPPAPWAQGMPRRAMTPPPRGVPRFDGAHDRHYSTMSGGRAPFRGRPPPPKKKLPPPKALTSLPTPHMLKDDAALFNAGDFAPPTSFRERQNGRRPDSPLGTQRPFSPSVRAFSPLVSANQSLNPLPSPHELRRSGTFTSLDFSPSMPRFRGMEGTGSRAGSDAGSIRSARSGISAMQMDAVRAGAYRVSRIPKEYVTSKNDITHQLRPKMDLTTPA